MIKVQADLYRAKYQSFSNEIFEKTVEFVREHTKIFDESHDFDHAWKVMCTSMKIYDDQFDGFADPLHVICLALLHDVCDHKYPESIKRSQLTAWIKENIPQYAFIDDEIEQISFSKQQKYRSTHGGHDYPVSNAVTIVRDADRLEAIGPIGIGRCRIFGAAKGKTPEEVERGVIEHCFEKLLLIYPQYYITTRVGRSLAVDAHNYILMFLRQKKEQVEEMGFDIPRDMDRHSL